MRYIINCYRFFYWASLALLGLSVYGFITQDPLWSIFIVAAGLMAYFSTKELMDIEEDIQKCLNSLVYDIKEFCDGADEGGIYTLELYYEYYTFKIKIYYSFEEMKETGATFMGDCEIFYGKDKEYIAILKVECFNAFNEPYDYGITDSKLQDKL